MRQLVGLSVVSLLGCQSDDHGSVVVDMTATDSATVTENVGDDQDDEDASVDLDSGDTGLVDTAPPVDTEYDLSIQLTADDAWVLWVNDTRLGEAEGWTYTDIHDTEVSLYQDGNHVIAIHAYDVHGVISGLIASVALDGVPKSVTGDGQWKMTTTKPAVNWTRAQFDDSTWLTPELVDSSDVSYFWKNRPADLIDDGAQWVWDGQPRALNDVWFRYVFSVP